jgi:hypothetical protein
MSLSLSHPRQAETSNAGHHVSGTRLPRLMIFMGYNWLRDSQEVREILRRVLITVSALGISQHHAQQGTGDIYYNTYMPTNASGEAQYREKYADYQDTR